MVREERKKLIWILWAIVWPISVLAILIYFPPKFDHSYLDIVAMGIMIIVIAISYFRVSGVDIFIIQSVSMAVFLVFGLAIELILVQIGVIAYLTTQRLTKQYSYRFPVNMLMFLFVSVTSAGFYYLIGGHVGTLGPGQSPQLLQIVGYGFMAFFSNHIAFYLVSKAFYDDAEFFGEPLIWEFVTTALTMPISYIFYILYSEFGSTSILMVSIPIMTLSVIFRLISQGSRLNKQLKETSDIGGELSQKLEPREVYTHFFQSIYRVLSVEGAYLFIFSESKELKEIRAFNESGAFSVIDHSILPQSGNSFLNTPYIAKTRKEWDAFLEGLLNKELHSVMTIPCSLDHSETGVFLIANNLKYGYKKQEQMIFEIMTHFFSIAIKNASNYEKTKMESERDPLTNLYNYRYFTNILHSTFFESHNPFSIIMLDLDHFKNINDQYGHENGNKVLLEVADRLMQAIGDQGVVARYGGEEFIILLRNTTNLESYELAERLRVFIGDEPFSLDPFGLGNKQSVIRVTASIGVATAPEQGEDAVTLIRNADRAMYSGAKQKGRNRVAVYSK